MESLTFADDSFDLFVAQDVMGHVFKPDLSQGIRAELIDVVVSWCPEE